MKTALRSCKCCSGMGLAIRTSSMYTYAEVIPRRTWSINLWKVSAAFLRPKGILMNSNNPKGVVAAVLGMSEGATGTWW